MALRDRIRQKAHTWVRRESVFLPETKETVQVRGLVTGELSRLSAVPESKRVALQTALATEDPETGQMLWNPNVLEDMQEIDALPGPDILAISEVVQRLSGQGPQAEAEGKEISSEMVSSGDISSVSVSESPLVTSVNGSQESRISSIV